MKPLLRTTHTAPARRILAALVALGLTGVPATVEHLTAGRARHRCQCPAGQHVCRCPVCRSAGHAARRAALAELPPCHRAKALEALAREEADERRSAPAAAPGLRSSCDGPEERRPAPTGQELVLPAPAAVCARGWSSRVAALAGSPRARAREPELPPPRRA